MHKNDKDSVAVTNFKVEKVAPRRPMMIILFVKSGDHGQIINTNTKRKKGDKMW
jgi:hypothetical protein